MTYVIAEIGVNHNGRYAVAAHLVQCAQAAGADAIKVQIFDHRTIDRPPYVRRLLKDLELSPIQLWQLAKIAHRIGVQAIATVFTLDDLWLAETMGCWDKYKISHSECNNNELIDHALATGKQVIVSYPGDGPILFRTDCARMWCCPKYPTPISEVNWNSVGFVEGFSDHTGCVEAGELAARAGATVIEAHITNWREQAGPDHSSSITVEHFPEYVRRAKAAALVECQ